MQSGLKHRQRGATFLGIVTIVAILGLAVYAGIRLVPLYMDYFSVVKAMTLTASSLKGGDVSPAAIRTALARHWEIDYISTVEAKDIEVNKVANGTEMRAAYRAEAPFVGNISLVVDFDKSVIIDNGSGP
jgi:hypothetical protein